MTGRFAALGLVAVLAYLPPPSYVFDRWVEKIQKVKTIHVRQETTYYDAAYPGGSALFDEEIWLKRPSYFRKTIQNAKSRMDLLVTPSKAYRIVSGKADVLPPVDAMGPVGVFFFPDGVKRFQTMLRQLGVDPETTRWVLKDPRVVYEVGRPNEARISFRKDEWVPSGALWAGREYLLTVNLPSQFPIPYPEAEEVLFKGARVFQTRVVSVKTDVPMDDTLFDVALLRGTPVKK
jgi:hypothetical protein